MLFIFKLRAKSNNQKEREKGCFKAMCLYIHATNSAKAVFFNLSVLPKSFALRNHRLSVIGTLYIEKYS